MVQKASAVSFKVKHIPILWPSNFTPGYLPKRNKNIHLQRPHARMFCFIHNSQYVCQQVKQTVVYSYNRVLLSNKKKKWWFTQYSTIMSKKCKKVRHNKYIPYDAIYIQNSRQAKVVYNLKEKREQQMPGGHEWEAWELTGKGH